MVGRTVRAMSLTRYYLRALAILLMLAFGANLLTPFLMGTWGYGVGYWSGWLFLVALAIAVAAGLHYFVRWYRADAAMYPARDGRSRTHTAA